MGLFGLGLGPDRQYASLFQLVKEDRADELLAKMKQVKLPAGGLDEIRGGKHKFTLLQKAVWCGSSRCVQLLMQLGASCTVKDEDGRTVLHLLVLGVHNRPAQLNAAVSLQQQLLPSLPAATRTQLDVADRDGTPLLLALMYQMEPLARGFLAAGLKINSVLQGDKSNALHLATLPGNAALRMDLIQAAEQRGQLQDLVNQPTLQGTTPLHAAVSSLIPDMVSRMLQLPFIKINKQDGNSRTPLHLAMRCLASPNQSNKATAAELSRMLLERDAGLDIPDREGNTCLSQAIDMAMLVVRKQVVGDTEALLQPLVSIAEGYGQAVTGDMGRVLDTPSKQEGVCAVHVAAMLGKISLISGLINRGAKVDIKDKRGQLPSVLAAKAGHTGCLIALFGPLGANPVLMDKHGMSAVASLLLTPSTRISQDELKDIMLAAVDSPNLPDEITKSVGKGLALQPICSSAGGGFGPLPLLPLACVTGQLDIVKALVEEAWMLPDVPNSAQATPLSATVAALCAAPTSAAKFVPIIEFLVRKGANPVRQYAQGAGTPLGDLVDHGQLSAVMGVLRHAKQHVHFKSPSGATALYLAIVQGNVAAVRELVSQLGAHAGPQPLFTPLHVAVGCQQPAVVQFLLGNAEARSGINQLDCHKRTPLAYCWTAWRTDALAAGHMSPATRARSMDVNATQVQLAQLLLEQPDCDPNTPVDASGRRMLHLAVDQGRFALIKMMAVTARGLDPNLPDADGMSPLHRAVQRGETNVVQAMLSLPDSSHPVKVDMGVFKACMQLLDTKPSVCESILAVLLDPSHASKCSIDLSNARAFTLTAKIGNERVELPPLHHVACLDKARMVDLLVKQGKAVVSATDSRGLTALHHAVACKAMTAANALVNNGADISALGNAPTTPLIAAVQDLDVGMVALLLSSTKPFNINATDGQGHTAVTMAAHRLFAPSYNNSNFGRSDSNQSGSPSPSQPSSRSNLAQPSTHPSSAFSASSFDAIANIYYPGTSSLPLPTPTSKPSLPVVHAFSTVSVTASTAMSPAPSEKPSGASDIPWAAVDILQLLLRKGADANRSLPPSAMHEATKQLSRQLTSMVTSRRVLPHTPRSTSPGTNSSGPQSSSRLSPSPRLLRSYGGFSMALAAAGGQPSDAMDLSEVELFTPLLLAIQLRSERVLDFLLQETRDDLDINGARSWSAVQVAVQCLQLLMAQQLSEEPQQPGSGRESRTLLDKLLNRDMVVSAGMNGSSAGEAVEAAMRVLERLLRDHRLDLTVPFEGMVLQHMAEMGGPCALRVARLLLSAPGTHADINARHPRTGSTALHTAAVKHDKEMIEVLANVKGVDFNILDNNGHTPLAVAVQAGACDVITSLLQLGLSNHLAADILDPTKCSQDPATSPTALAMAHSEHRVLQTLVAGLSMANNMVAQTAVPMPQHQHKTSSGSLKTPAPAPYSPTASRQYDIEAVLNQPIDSAGRSPVLVACKALHFDHVHVLVKAEHQTWPVAALDVAEPPPLNRSTPLAYGAGAVNGNVDAEHTLATPLHMVLEYIITLKSKPRSTKGLQEQLTRACVLASDMASAPSMATAVGMKDAVGFTPLHWAVMARCDDVVRALCYKARKLGCIDASADTDKGQGVTPLHLAVQLNSVACAHCLLTHGASVKSVLRDGHSTPLRLCTQEQNEMRQLLMNPPPIISQDAAYGFNGNGYGSLAAGQQAYKWDQVKNTGTSTPFYGKKDMAEQDKEARKKAASKALYGTFKSTLEIVESAKEAVGPISQALGCMAIIAKQLLESVEKLAFSNMLVAHITGRINRQIPTLNNLKTALEQSKNDECALQLLPHVKNLGEVYIKVHGMVEVWSSTARGSKLARLFASQEFWDDLVLQGNILSACMTDLGTVVNSFHMMGFKIQAECQDPEKVKEEMKALIRQDMQMAMQHMLEAETMGGDVSEAQKSAEKLFKEYGLDYNKLKKKEQRKWKGDKLKELIIAPSELQILGKVGTGGSAEVFRALYQGHPVAYKQFQALPSQGDVLQSHVEMEAYIMSQLRHPNIIQIFGCVLDKAKRQYGLVVDYHAPGSLQSMISQCLSLQSVQSVPVSVQERVALVLQIACGMAYLHTRSVEPIVHGDLKPSNVLVSEDGRAVITDFGLSRITSNSTTTTAVHAHSNTFTSDASTVYTAPEVPELLLNNKRRAPSADVFSFGVLCLEVLTLQPCYTGFAANPEEYTRKVARGQRPFIPDEIPAPLRDCIQSCWHHNPQHRPSFVQVVEVLDQVYAMIS